MSPNLSYNRGRALEYKVRDAHKKEGWEVFRTAGSHTMADLVCLKFWRFNSDKGTAIRLVQCKGSKKLMSKKELEDFIHYCDDLGVQPILAYYEKRKLKLDVL